MQYLRTWNTRQHLRWDPPPYFGSCSYTNRCYPCFMLPLLKQDACNVFGPWMHASTFGGNELTPRILNWSVILRCRGSLTSPLLAVALILIVAGLASYTETNKYSPNTGARKQYTTQVTRLPHRGACIHMFQ